MQGNSCSVCNKDADVRMVGWHVDVGGPRDERGAHGGQGHERRNTAGHAQTTRSGALSGRGSWRYKRICVVCYVFSVRTLAARAKVSWRELLTATSRMESEGVSVCSGAR